MLRRVEIHPDDIVSSGFEVRIHRAHVAFEAMRLQTRRAKRGRRCCAGRKMPTRRAGGPMRRPVWRRPRRPHDNAALQLRCQRRRLRSAVSRGEPTMITDVELDGLFKRLSLANGRRMWRDLVQRAERGTRTYRDFLTLLVTEEIAHRRRTRRGRLSRRAHFPFLKTIDDFDFTYQSTVRLSVLGSALSPDFVTEGRSRILTGRPGRGKTHLTIAIAYRAIQNEFDALFTTAATLIDDLSSAFAPANSPRRCKPTRIPPSWSSMKSATHLRHRRRQHTVSPRQRPPSPAPRHGVYDEQIRD